jgi:hypothetical protein
MKFIALVSLLSSATATVAQSFANDECIGAKEIPQTFPYSEIVDITNYTNNPTDPTLSCNVYEVPLGDDGDDTIEVQGTDGKTLWYKFTPPTDGVLSFVTDDRRERFGPGLDMVLGAFTGSCSSLTEVKCVNGGFAAEEELYPTVRGGITYYIKVGDAGENPFGSGFFNFTVLFEPKNLTVVGDECTNAKVISHASLPFNEIVDIRLYSNNANDIISTCNEKNAEGNTLWYKYTPPFDGLMIASTVGSKGAFFGFPLDNVIGAFTGTCNRLTQVFCVDQDSEDTLFYPVKAGVTYTIKLEEYGASGSALGLLNFSLSFQRNYFNVLREDEGVYQSAISDILNGIFKNGYEDEHEGHANVIGVLNDVFNGKYPGLVPANTIDYSKLNTSSLSIEAKFTEPNAVQSVLLKLDNRQPICENFVPYEISGPFSIGNRLIDATGYSRSSCRGNVLGKISQRFFVGGCRFIQYGLYDADRNTYVTNLYNASTVSTPPCSMSIGVTFQCGFVPKIVRFELRRASNNALVLKRDETSAPYFLFGNIGNDIVGGSIPSGEYILTAIIDGITHPSVRFTFGTCKRNNLIVDKSFDIDLRFELGYLSTYEIAKLFPPIVKRISSLIVGDRPDFVVSYYEYLISSLQLRTMTINNI